MGNGGTVAWVGHLYGFGNTLDKALRERFLAMFEALTGVVGARSVAVRQESRWTDRSITRLWKKGWGRRAPPPDMNVI